MLTLSFQPGLKFLFDYMDILRIILFIWPVSETALGFSAWAEIQPGRKSPWNPLFHFKSISFTIRAEIRHVIAPKYLIFCIYFNGAHSLPFDENRSCQSSEKTQRLFLTTWPTWNYYRTLNRPQSSVLKGIFRCSSLKLSNAAMIATTTRKSQTLTSNEQMQWFLQALHTRACVFNFDDIWLTSSVKKAGRLKQTTTASRTSQIYIFNNEKQ